MHRDARELSDVVTCILSHHCSEPPEQEGLGAHSHLDPTGLSSVMFMCCPNARISMQSDLHKLWGNSEVKGAAFLLRKEIAEHKASFCFPCVQRNITQIEPEAHARNLSCDFQVVFGVSLVVLFDVSPALQDPRVVWASFVHSVLVLLLPL